MKNTTNSKKRTAVIVIALLLLAACVMLFGKPFLTGVNEMDEGQTVCFRIWNPTTHPVSWTYQLLDENSQPVPSDYFPSFVAHAEPIVTFGTATDVIELSQPLPIGSYTLRVVFR